MKPMATAFYPRLPRSAVSGLLKDASKHATIDFKREGDVVILIGETKGHLGQSIYLREIESKEEGGAPPVDLAAEKKHGNFVRGLIEIGRLDTVHDVSDGGLLVAIAEMALKGDIGADIGQASLPDAVPFFFGEDQARYVIAAPFRRSREDHGRSPRRHYPGGGIGQNRRRRHRDRWQE